MTTTSASKDERTTARAARFALAVGYLCLAALYSWQASKRVSPTIFSDEIEFTQISRAIAEHGVPSRRGAPSGFETLVAACEAHGVACRVVRREIEPAPSLLRTTTE